MQKLNQHNNQYDKYIYINKVNSDKDWKDNLAAIFEANLKLSM